jgi:hypothetical protein
MLSCLRRKILWFWTAIVLLALLAGLSLVACSQPNDPVSKQNNPVIPPIDAATPNITGQPTGGDWDVGDEEIFELSVTATISDGGTLSYQWHSNTSPGTAGGTAVGTNSASLTLNKTDYATADKNGPHYFYVIVTNTNSGATGKKTAAGTSEVAEVQVNGAGDVYLVHAAQPNITGQPTGGLWDVRANETFPLTVAASVSDGGTLSYQWYSNASNGNTGGSPLGTNSATLTLNKADYAENDDCYFYVIVTNTNSGATGKKTAARTSNVATVTVAGNAIAPVSLANGVWSDGALTAAINFVEYTFDVERDQIYYVWWNDKNDGPTPGNKTVDIRVSARYSDETEYIFGGEGIAGVDASWTTPQIFTADRNDSVTVMVTPFSPYAINNTGTFAVAFSTVSIRPGAAVAKTITANQWADDTISTDEIHVYSINVTQGTEYHVWWNERPGFGNNGDGTKTADVQVQARYADDTLIFNNNADYADQWSASAWVTPRTFTANMDGTVDLRVRPNLGISGYNGSYGIVYSTSSTRPLKGSAELLSVNANGGYGTPTTALTLTFDNAVYGLSADDIKLEMPGIFDVKKGTLSGAGTSYILGVSSPIDGTVTVRVDGVLLDITGSPKEVVIYGDGGASITPLVENQWADGELPEENSVDWYRISVSAGTTYYVWWNDKMANHGDGFKTGDVVVGAWRADGTLIFGGTNFVEDNGWQTPKSFTATVTDGTVYVRVRPFGNNTSDYLGTYGLVYSTVNTRPTVIYPPDIPVTLNISANGGSGTPTTALTLVLSQAISGLSADDITVTMSMPFRVSKGNLSGAGTSYTLGVSSPIDGIMTVTVAKNGYDISGSPAQVNIYSDNSIAFKSLVAGQWTDGNLPQANSVDWYKITVTAGTTYRIWWNDKDDGNGTKTGDVVVGAWFADGTNFFGNSTATTDKGWDTVWPFTPSAAGTVYVRVMPYDARAAYVGSYGIVFTADNPVRPNP